MQSLQPRAMPMATWLQVEAAFHWAWATAGIAALYADGTAARPRLEEAVAAGPSSGSARGKKVPPPAAAAPSAEPDDWRTQVTEGGMRDGDGGCSSGSAGRALAVL